jgi:hypothetical protein
MKIAILMFGQPRFLEYTINLIREEYELPGHDVHYFAHFWDKIGYIPHGEEEPYDREDLYTLIKKNLPGSILPNKPEEKNIVITGYDELDVTIDNLLGYVKTHDRRLPITIHDPTGLRYKFGQHWSMKECFKRIKAYENQNNFQYEIIIKVRTDIVYQPKEMYRSVKQYNHTKQEMYTNLCIDTPLVKCAALRYVDLTEKRKDRAKEGYNQGIYYFYNNHFRIDKHLQTNHNCEEEVGWIKHIENYNKRLAFNDWSLIANRKGAEIVFGNWFENYFLTLSKDIRHNSTTSFFISQSDHSIQGQMLLNYNLAACRIVPRRDVRLLHPKIIKKDVIVGNKILAESESQIKKDILEHKFR